MNMYKVKKVKNDEKKKYLFVRSLTNNQKNEKYLKNKKGFVFIVTIILN